MPKGRSRKKTCPECGETMVKCPFCGRWGCWTTVSKNAGWAANAL